MSPHSPSSASTTVGFLVNPIAGMGGPVGLKGTDGLLPEARIRGAVARAPVRAKETLGLLKDAPFRFLTCSGSMGGDILREAGISGAQVVYSSRQAATSAKDTWEACRIFLSKGTDLILFCGGDGTARDVYDAIGNRIPILGIPAGVKMYSAVFSVTPAAAAEILLQQGPGSFSLPIRDAEIVDVDEGAYRRGELRTRLYGIARSPYLPGLVQGTKAVFEDRDDDRARDGIALFLSEVMEGTPETLYILGPGSTTGAIARRFGLEKTLLGFDAIYKGRIVGRDLNEASLLALLDKHVSVRLVVSVIGAQGAVLGRGTQQVSPTVLRRIGIPQVIVVATPHKLSETPILFLDTGDPGLDAGFGEFIQVITGYRTAQRKHLQRSQGDCP